VRRYAVSSVLLLFLSVFPNAVGYGDDAEEQPESHEEPPQEPAPAAGPPSVRQVQLHVWISETTEQGLRALGAELNYTRFVDGIENPTDSVQQITTDVFDENEATFGVTLPAPDQSRFPPPLRPDRDPETNGIQTQSGAGLNFTLIKDDHGTINGVFRSIEQKGDVDLFSKPELLVIDGVKAEISAGGQVPYQGLSIEKRTAETKLDVRFIDIGVNMSITPRIIPDDFIELDIEELNVKDVTRFENIRGIDLPVVSERSQTGKVIVPNAQTFIIGGLSNRVIRKSERRVPLLGVAFRGRDSEVFTNHILMFVQPTIVDLRAMSPEATSALQFWRSGGWKNKGRIEQEIRRLEEEYR
jgi:type II secretory pathway component GspD/PulD (secretin)